MNTNFGPVCKFESVKFVVIFTTRMIISDFQLDVCDSFYENPFRICMELFFSNFSYIKYTYLKILSVCIIFLFR